MISYWFYFLSLGIFLAPLTFTIMSLVQQRKDALTQVKEWQTMYIELLEQYKAIQILNHQVPTKRETKLTEDEEKTELGIDWGG